MGEANSAASGFRRIAANWHRLGRLYAIPLMLVYGAWAMAFWPGVLSFDSLDTWNEAESGAFTRAHSATFNILVRLITRVWHSPAAVITVQIAVLVLTLAWGLRETVKLGGSRALAWVSIAILSLIPSHAIVAISLWPDAFYSAAVLVFSVQIVRLLAAAAPQSTAFRQVAPVVVSGVLVALLRPNGPPIPFLTLGLVVLASARLRRFAAITLVSTLAAYLLIDRPLYRLLGVQPGPESSGALTPFVLQVAAHTVAGTPIDEQDAAFLREVYPTIPWPYACTSGMATGFAPNFHGEPIRQNPRALLSAWWHLTRKAPQVNLQHQLCLDAFVWKVTGTPMFLYPFNFDHHELRSQKLGHVPLGNTLPVDQGFEPLWPVIEKSIQVAGTAEAWPVTWAPGTYLYLLLLVLGVAAARLRTPLLTLAAAPVLANTLAISLFAGTMEFRYLLSTVLTALVFLPLIAARRSQGPAAVPP